MRVHTALSLALLNVVFAASAAHADLVPNGQKSVKLAIRVDGDVPADKALVLARTFRGADVLSTGKVLPVEWHPMAGAMGLVMIDAASAAKIEDLRKNMDRDALKKITEGGVSCSPPIECPSISASGARTVRPRPRNFVRSVSNSMPEPPSFRLSYATTKAAHSGSSPGDRGRRVASSALICGTYSV